MHTGAATCINQTTPSVRLFKMREKINNLDHITHSVQVGRNAMVIATTIIGSGANIGYREWVATSATLCDGFKIGNKAIIWIHAVVTKPVSVGELWGGHPACRFPQR